MLPDGANQTHASQEEVLKKKNQLLVLKMSPERNGSSAGATVSVTTENRDRDLKRVCFYLFIFLWERGQVVVMAF